MKQIKRVLSIIGYIVLVVIPALLVYITFVITYIKPLNLKMSQYAPFTASIAVLWIMLSVLFIYIKTKRIDKKVENVRCSMCGNAFILRGYIHLQKGDYQKAIDSYIPSLYWFNECQDDNFLQEALTLIMECLPKLNKQNIQESETKFGLTLFEILDAINDRDINGAFTKITGDMKATLNKLQ